MGAYGGRVCIHDARVRIVMVASTLMGTAPGRLELACPLMVVASALLEVARAFVVIMGEPMIVPCDLLMVACEAVVFTRTSIVEARPKFTSRCRPWRTRHVHGSSRSGNSRWVTGYGSPVATMAIVKR
jgi:hypothetical protein